MRQIVSKINIYNYFLKFNLENDFWDVLPNFCDELKNYDPHCSYSFIEFILNLYRGYKIGFFKNPIEKINLCSISREKRINLNSLYELVNDLEVKGYLIRDTDGTLVFTKREAV